MQARYAFFVWIEVVAEQEPPAGYPKRCGMLPTKTMLFSNETRNTLTEFQEGWAFLGRDSHLARQYYGVHGRHARGRDTGPPHAR